MNTNSMLPVLKIKSDCILDWWGKVLRKQGLGIWWTQLHKAVKKSCERSNLLHYKKMKSRCHNFIVDNKGLYPVEKVDKPSKMIYNFVKFG